MANFIDAISAVGVTVRVLDYSERPCPPAGTRAGSYAECDVGGGSTARSSSVGIGG